MPHHIMGKVMRRASKNGSNVSKSGLSVSCLLAIFSSLTFMVSSSLSILVLQQRGKSQAQIVNCYRSGMELFTVFNHGILDSICVTMSVTAGIHLKQTLNICC